jgi:predicted RNA-binding Zn-ribbon protein involved in translation (DUF1610 family)
MSHEMKWKRYCSTCETMVDGHAEPTFDIPCPECGGTKFWVISRTNHELSKQLQPYLPRCADCGDAKDVNVTESIYPKAPDKTMLSIGCDHCGDAGKETTLLHRAIIYWRKDAAAEEEFWKGIYGEGGAHPEAH